MKNKSIIILSILGFISAQSGALELEKCLGPVCVNQASGLYINVQRLYAARVNVKTLPQGEASRAACAPVNQRISAIFLYEGDTKLISASDLGMLGLTRLNACHHKVFMKSPALALINSQLGKLLDANQLKVKKVMGRPTHIVDTVKREAEDSINSATFGSKKYGTECWIYSDENDSGTLLANTICFDQNKKVITVWISDMP
jgi:hypothetical protein